MSMKPENAGEFTDWEALCVLLRIMAVVLGIGGLAFGGVLAFLAALSWPGDFEQYQNLVVWDYVAGAICSLGAILLVMPIAIHKSRWRLGVILSCVATAVFLVGLSGSLSWGHRRQYEYRASYSELR